MRIAFVADTFHSGIGGGVVAGQRVVDRLREHHHVTVIAADAREPGEVRVPGFQLPIRAMKKMQFHFARPDRRILAREFAAADVVHLQFPFWLSWVAIEEAQALGRPVVAAFHVQPENAFLNIGLRSARLNAFVYRRWVARYFQRADAVVCPSFFAKRKLERNGLTAPAFVISNGVPPDLKPSAAPRDPRHSGRFVVASVGRFAIEKRQEVLIEAVLRSRHRERIHLVLAGAGPREAALARLAKGLPSVEMGFLSRERLRAVLGTSDLFVHTSEVELEGIAVIEAMSMGCPVLVADAPESAASDIALDDRFRFRAGDAEQLAARIDALLDAPAELARTRALHKDASRRYDFDASTERLVDVYRFVLRERSKVRHRGGTIGADA
jgi:glycosyltransferase involved in cell wall biosynthesis